MTVTLELEPAGADGLRREADELGVTPEQLAADIIRRHVAARVPTSAAPTAFRAALSASMAENEELLRRLAK